MITWLYAIGILLVLEYLLQLLFVGLDIYIGRLTTKQEVRQHLIPIYPVVWLFMAYRSLPEKEEKDERD